MTAKLLLYLNISFCAPLIPLEISISKKSSFSKLHVCIFSIQPMQLFCHNTYNLFIHSVAYNPSTYVPFQETFFEQTDGARNVGVTAEFIQLAPVPANMTHFSTIAWTSQSMGQPKLHAKTIHHTQKYCSDRAI